MMNTWNSEVAVEGLITDVLCCVPGEPVIELSCNLIYKSECVCVCVCLYVQD
jgi:hypothetical protein